MTVPERRSLPPMEATEFAIDAAFRHCVFALGLVIGWGVVLLPLAALAWFVGLRNGMPDPKALPPAGMAVLGLLGLGVLVACLSMGVNWNRRLLSGARPSLAARWRLDGAVWRYLAGVILVLVVLGVYASLGAAVMTAGVPALAPRLGAAARPLGIAATVLIGFSGLFSFCRLLSWLPAIAIADPDYGLREAWRRTRANRFAFLAFTFWLLFSLGIAAALGAGAFFAQQQLPQPWVKPTAFAAMGVLAWLALLMIHSVPAALYRTFR